MYSQLLYVSAAVCPLGDLSDLDIMRTAEKFNREHDITGFLLRGSKWFCQYLEGPKERIDSLFDRIKTDNRHYAVTSWEGGPVSERLFGEWCMGYGRLLEPNPELLLLRLSSSNIELPIKARLMREIAEEYMRFKQNHDISEADHDHRAPTLTGIDPPTLE